MQQTSIDAYLDILNSGRLNELQMSVYAIISHGGPITQGEAWHKYGCSQAQRHTIAPRFNELHKMGVIMISGRRICNVSGRSALTWEITGLMPHPVEKKESKSQTIKRLEARIKELEYTIEASSH